MEALQSQAPSEPTPLKTDGAESQDPLEPAASATTAAAVNDDAVSEDEDPPNSATANKQSRLNRRRSRKACYSCHARKVRCDVTHRGAPCTNCKDDKVPCIIRERKNRRAPVQPPGLAPVQESSHDQQTAANARRPSDAQRPPSNLSQQPVPPPPPANCPPVQITNYVNPFAADPGFIDPRSQFQGLENLDSWSHSGGMAPPTPGFNGFHDHFGNSLPPNLDIDYDGLAGLENIFTVADSLHGPNAPPIDPNADPFSLSSPSNTALSAAPSTESPNAHQGNLTTSPPSHALPPEDFAELFMGSSEDRHFLKSQGCFTVPSSTVLREMMGAYFQFVHPNLAIINEAEVWNLWQGDRFRLGSYSLLVLQAMSFVASGFASLSTLQKCGFSTQRKARILLYRRCKLLFDFGVEADPINMSQAALLLTYHSPNSNQRQNTQWLMQGIHYAQVARADKFYEEEPGTKRAAVLKRLWWGCLLRDRILPLGLRRAPQIDHDLTHMGENRYLTQLDFQDELGHSAVHDADTQVQIFQIIEQQCRLVDALSPTIFSLYQVEQMLDRSQTTVETLPKKLEEVRINLKRLYQWHDRAIRKFPSPVSLGDTPDAVTIFANLLFIIFDAAIIALCSHAMLMWEVRTPAKDPASERGMYQSPATEIMRAVSDTSDRTKELVQTGTAKYLPISASAFFTLPLLLHALNVTAAAGTNSECIERRQLDIYSAAMRLQSNIYEGTDFCYSLIQHIMAYTDDERFTAASSGASTRGASEDRPSHWKYSAKASSVGKATGKMGWEDLLTRKPRLFLRLSLHVDVAFCVGRQPQERDFPVQLRRGSN